MMQIFLIEEKNLKGDIIVRCIDTIINDFELMDRIKDNLKKLDVENSASIIYDNIKKLIDRK